MLFFIGLLILFGMFFAVDYLFFSAENAELDKQGPSHIERNLYEKDKEKFNNFVKEITKDEK